MNESSCTNCGIPLDLTAQQDGIAVCSQCGTRHRVAPQQAMGEPADQGFPPLQPPPPSTPSFPVPGAHAAPVVEIATAEQDADRAAHRWWLPVTIGGVALVVSLGLAWWAFSGGGTKSPDDTKAEKQAADVATSQPPANELDPGVLDLSDLTALDSLGTKDPESPSESLSPTTQRNAYGWPQGVTLFSIPAEQVANVDGVALTELTDLGFNSTTLLLPVPQGNHLIQGLSTQPGNSLVSTGFAEHYDSQRARFRGPEGLDAAKLDQAAVRSSGWFREPVLPHLIGDSYWERGEPESAKRFWWTAVRLSPAFAPSHLNLAYAAVQSGDMTTASREFQFASALNIQDTFGIAGHLSELHDQITAPEKTSPTARYSPLHYLPEPDINPQTRRVIDVLMTLNDFATTPEDKAACYNNIGVFLWREQGEPESAVNYFLQARQELASDGGTGVSPIAQTILENLAESAEAAGIPESALFRQISVSLQ